MHPHSIKSNYTDTLARKRRAKVFVGMIIFAVATIGMSGGLIYLFFFSKFFDLRSIALNGLTSLNSEQVNNIINLNLDSKIFHYIPRKNNILSLDTAEIRNNLLAKFPILKSVDIKRKYPHELVFNFQERTAVGIWCFGGDNCQYFDSDGNTWGIAIKSSGFLMLSVDDKRNRDDNKIDVEYFKAIKIFIDHPKDLHFILSDIIIDQASFRDFKVNSSEGYPILFSLDSNIAEQIRILGIFLQNKEKESEFKPQYIDLRIDGRVYYK